MHGANGHLVLLFVSFCLGVIALFLGVPALAGFVQRLLDAKRKSRQFAWPQEGEVREVYLIGYAIKVHYLEGIWYSPFTNASGVHFNSSNINGLRHSIRGCIKSPKRFRKQFEKLCADKIIVKVSERKTMPYGANDTQPERRAS